MRPTVEEKTAPTPPLAAQALFWALIFLWTLSPLAGYDFWYYLALGRSVIEEQAVPWAQSYLGTTKVYGFGRYADAAWLGNTGFYLVYSLAGVFGLVLFKSALLTGTTYITYLNCRLLGLVPTWAMLWSALALWTIRGRFELRTYLLTDLLLAVLVFFLLKYQHHQSLRRLSFEVLPLMVLWTNVHQGVIAGCYLLFGWWLFGGLPRSRGLIFGLGVALAVLFKPYGLQFLHFLKDMFGNTLAMQGVVEWGAPSWGLVWSQLGLFLLALLVLIPCGVVQRRQKGEPLPPLVYLGVALYFLVLGLSSIRAQSEWLPVVAPLAAAYFPLGQGSRRLRRAAAFVLALVFVVTFRTGSWSELGSVEKTYPADLVHALPKEGQVFNTFEHGNFLVYKEIPPFIHGMTSVYREGLLQDYIDVLNADPRTPEILRRFQVESMLLHFPSSLDATGNLLEYLGRSGQWRLEAFDDQGLLFLKGNPKDGLSALRPWDQQSPWTDPTLAEEQLRELVGDWPSARAYVLLSRLAAEREDWPAARVAAERAVELGPDRYAPWYQYGLVAAKEGRLASLLVATKNSVRVAPNDPIAQLQRGLALEAQAETTRGFASWWSVQRARYHFRRALYYDPELEPARRHLEAL